MTDLLVGFSVGLLTASLVVFMVSLIVGFRKGGFSCLDTSDYDVHRALLYKSPREQLIYTTAVLGIIESQVIRDAIRKLTCEEVGCDLERVSKWHCEDHMMEVFTKPLAK